MEDADSRPSTKGDVDRAIDLLRRDHGARMDGLDQKIDRVVVEVVRNQARLSRVEENMATKDDIRRVLGAVQDFAAKAEAYGRIATVHGQSLTDDQITLKDHERRLRRLES